MHKSASEGLAMEIPCHALFSTCHSETYVEEVPKEGGIEIIHQGTSLYQVRKDGNSLCRRSEDKKDYRTVREE